MGIQNVVVALLVLLLGLKLVASPLLSSILSIQVGDLGYKWLPSLGAAIIITVVVLARIKADAQVRMKREERQREQDEPENSGMFRGRRSPYDRGYRG